MGTILGRAAGPSAGRGKHQTTADDFAELGWEVLRVSETAGALPSVEIDFALAHPDFGVALVDVLHAHPEPVKRLRDRLAEPAQPPPSGEFAQIDEHQPQIGEVGEIGRASCRERVLVTV